MKLNQVTVPATDINVSSEFYRALGLLQIVSSPHYARFECPCGDTEPATFSIHLHDGAIAQSGTVVYFECVDLDERVSSLQNRGIVFEKLPTTERWLWREARLNDPAGNQVCLYFAGEHRRFPPWRVSP